MVQLEEVEDDELDQVQPGPMNNENDDDFTDTGSFVPISTAFSIYCNFSTFIPE